MLRPWPTIYHHLEKINSLRRAASNSPLIPEPNLSPTSFLGLLVDAVQPKSPRNGQYSRKEPLAGSAASAPCGGNFLTLSAEGRTFG